MARRKKQAGPTPVDVYRHQDKRTNIPSADSAEFVRPEVQRSVPLRYPRNPDLDPQLVWRGKDDENAGDLAVDAPPLWVQEKIQPQALIENLRKIAERPEDEPELTLFDTFDDLDALAEQEHYQHSTTWSNRMILGDSLLVMGSLAERESLRGKVQMVYLDPPYGIKFGSNWQATTRSRDVTDGKVADVTRDVEQIKAFRDTWELGVSSYLSYLRDRLSAAHDLLTESGSCFVQIGDENVHLVRSLMDEVFGRENFVSLISFVTTSGFTQASALGRAGDYLIWYARDVSNLKTRPLWRESRDRQGYNCVQLVDGSRRSLSKDEKIDPSLLPEGARSYMPGDLQSQGAASQSQTFEFDGKVYQPGAESHWKANYPDGMNRLAFANRIHKAKNSIRFVRFADDFGWQPYTNNWTDTATGNFTDDKIYVVQTNTKVVERCMLMCTDAGDLVLDPTCGSGTTAFVAEQWGRRWITIDTSRVALALARQRLMGARYPYYLLSDSADGKAKEAELANKAAPPYIGSNDLHHGFVYERVQHVTLKSIANNPDIQNGMAPDDISAAIKRHADFEQLYDRPYEHPTKVRVSGPFTVESISPHRSVAFNAAIDDTPLESINEAAAAEDPDAPTFEQTVLDNLKTAGIQNGTRAERIEFASVESYAGIYIQAVGDPRDSDSGRIGLAIGPQYGTIDPGFIRDAAREAIRANDIDLLCVLGFSFDPKATGVTEEDGVTVQTTDAGFANVAGQRQLGRVQVLLVRINADLLMGDLKKTDAANLFTVFGEPDIELRTDSDGKFVVELRGVDVYDPTTGQIRSGGTDQIALWMIDTDYDEISFFVRHCYFTGKADPYSKLKTALKADIDKDAWDSLYSTTSRPFARPTTGRIAVKVINDYGDEVMKVIELDEKSD